MLGRSVAIYPRPGFANGINTNMSLILSELAKDWGTTLYALDFKTR
jgi:hypothetical protein